MDSAPVSPATSPHAIGGAGNGLAWVGVTWRDLAWRGKWWKRRNDEYDQGAVENYGLLGRKNDRAPKEKTENVNVKTYIFSR